MGRLVVVSCRVWMSLNHSTGPFCSRRRSRCEPANAGFRNNRVPPFQYGYAVNIVAFCVYGSLSIQRSGGICSVIWTGGYVFTRIGGMPDPAVALGTRHASKVGCPHDEIALLWPHAVGKALRRAAFFLPCQAYAARTCRYVFLHFRPPLRCIRTLTVVEAASDELGIGRIPAAPQPPRWLRRRRGRRNRCTAAPRCKAASDHNGSTSSPPAWSM